jgi:circadian clock protein KaiC
LKLLEVQLGPDGILTGAARQAHELSKKLADIKKQNELSRKDREIARKRKVLEANIEALKNEFESVEEELSLLRASEELQAKLALEKKERKK